VGETHRFEEHLKLMCDLQALAYQAEITRISTLLYSHETSGTVYPKREFVKGFTTRRITPTIERTWISSRF
jgi:Protein of unknown function (DUF1552)